MVTSQIFGNKSSFAIQCREFRDEFDNSLSDVLGICHLIIGGKLIGSKEECCGLGTWLYNLTDRRNFIVDRKNNLYPKEFKLLNNREIFESILKANQLEEEFNNEFLYLPQLDNQIWSSHSFEIDETIDGYLIYFYVFDNQITFLIEDNSGKFINNYRSNKFIFQIINFDFFIKTIEQVTSFLVHKYPYLKGAISTRRFNSS